MGILGISVQGAAVLFCQECVRVHQASVVYLETRRGGLDGRLFTPAANYWLGTREQIIWAVDETQPRCPHTSNSSSSCNSLFKRGGDGKAGVTPPAGCKKHDTHTQHDIAFSTFITSVQREEQAQHGILHCLEETALSCAVPDIPASYAWHSVSFPMTTLPLCLRSCRHHYISDF